MGGIFLPFFTFKACSAPSAPFRLGFCAIVARISPARTLATALGFALNPTFASIQRMVHVLRQEAELEQRMALTTLSTVAGSASGACGAWERADVGPLNVLNSRREPCRRRRP